ncbi:MAG: hypothetical protein RIC93_09895 [Alphaproteobacteria bacterium]
MQIDDRGGGVAHAFFAAASGQQNKNESGGGLLAAAQAVKPAGGANGGEETEAARNVRLVREKGFRAFVEALEEKKLAELREKILQSMGLSEEDLKEMDPDQRAAIEKLIAQNIRERLSAETELENGGDEKPAADEVTAQTLAARTGLGAGYAVLQALEAVEAAELAGQVPRPKDEF